MLVSWQKGGRHVVSPGNRTRTSTVGAHHNHNHHATSHCCVSNLTVNLIPLPQPRTDPGHIFLPRRCTRHFSLSHHARGFSRNHLHDSRNSPPTKPHHSQTKPNISTSFPQQILSTIPTDTFAAHTQPYSRQPHFLIGNHIFMKAESHKIASVTHKQ